MEQQRRKLLPKEQDVDARRVVDLLMGHRHEALLHQGVFVQARGD